MQQKRMILAFKERNIHPQMYLTIWNASVHLADMMLAVKMISMSCARRYASPQLTLRRYWILVGRARSVLWPGRSVVASRSDGRAAIVTVISLTRSPAADHLVTGRAASLTGRTRLSPAKSAQKACDCSHHQTNMRTS